MKLILASASPRRAEILRDAGFSFEVAQANIDETRLRGETARAMTRRLAEAKARAVAEKLGAEPPEAIVIGADTTVDLQGRLLGKPESAKAAREMLLKLSGKTHRVVTSVARSPPYRSRQKDRHGVDAGSFRTDEPERNCRLCRHRRTAGQSRGLRGAGNWGALHRTN